jgi:hypothetical protein
LGWVGAGPFLEAAGIRIENVAHLLAADSDDQSVQRVVRAAPWSEPIREPEEVFLVDRVQHRDGRPLDNFVLKGGNRERALPAIRLRYVLTPRWQCPIRPPLDPRVQILELGLKVCLVVPPRQPVHAGCRVSLEREKRQPEQVDADMVEERGEPFLLPLLSDLPYAAQRWGHAFPVLCPARAVLMVAGLRLRVATLPPSNWKLPKIRSFDPPAGPRFEPLCVRQ